MSMKSDRARALFGVCGLAAAVCAGTLVMAQSRNQDGNGQALGHGYSRPARSPHGSRSEVIAPHGMVAASHPLAAQVGIDILKSGGNAIDAAVAVNAVLGLVEPHMNGVGGDLFAIVWDNDTQQLYGLNATGRSPYEINRQVFVRGRCRARSTDGTSYSHGSGRWVSPRCSRRPSPTRATGSQ